MRIDPDLKKLHVDAHITVVPVNILQAWWFYLNQVNSPWNTTVAEILIVIEQIEMISTILKMDFG